MKQKTLMIMVAIFSLLIMPFYSFAEEMRTYPRMHVSLEDLNKKSEEIKELSLMTKSEPMLKSIEQADFSLKPYMHDIDATWDQGYCGNCWVWAGTLASEIAYSKYIDNPERFSIQYFSSNYCNGGDFTDPTTSSCTFDCRGGSIPKFANFYNETLKFIPWTNDGASDFVDYDGGELYQYMGYWLYKSHVAKEAISSTPNVPLVSMEARTIDTFNGNEKAINNIKKELIKGNAVLLSFYAFTDADWDNFCNAWGTQNEESLFDFESFGNKVISLGDVDQISGHGVVLVGFNDTDPDPSKHYWIVQNSWGVPENRPNGQFRFPMNMQYDITSKIQGLATNYYILEFEVLDTKFSNATSVIYGQISDPTGLGIKDVDVILNYEKNTKTSMAGNFVFDKVEYGKTFTLTFNKQGYIFEPSTYSKIAGEDAENVEILAMEDPAYQNCEHNFIPKDEILNHFMQLMQYQRDILDKTTNFANNQKSAKKRDKILAKVEASKEKMDKYLDRVKDALEDIPNELYTCNSKNCKASSHKTPKKLVKRQVPNILNLVKEDGEYLVKNNERRNNFVNKKVKKADKKADEILKMLSAMPGNNYFCE